jgi:hypothetical protein
VNRLPNRANPISGIARRPHFKIHLVQLFRVLPANRND